MLGIINDKYFKEIAPVVLSIVVGLCGNAIFSLVKNTVAFFVVLGILIISILADIVLVSYYIAKREQVNKLICESDEEIKDAMKKIMKMQGKVCIMSRDLSWVDLEVEKCIISKANSIMIFAERETALTERLKSNGVEIRYYGKLGFEPKTRFTILRYNTINPQVAIANTENSIRKRSKFKHTIYQTKSGNGVDEWINSLAIDMVC